MLSLLVGVVHPGVAHHCTKGQRNQNLLETARTFSTEGKRKFCAQILNEITNEEKIDKRSGSLHLPSGSKTLTVNFGDKKQKQMSTEDMIRLKNSENLSQEQTLGIANALRVTYGKKSVEPGLQKALPNMKFKLKDFFSFKWVDVTHKKAKKQTFLSHPLFLSNDVRGLIQYSVIERNLDPNNLELICGIDDGQSMLKV